MQRQFRLKQVLMTMMVFFLTIGTLSAEILVERISINNGAPRVLRHSWVDVECLVSNTDNKPHVVEVAIRPGDDYEGQTGFYSGEIRVPGKTSALMRFPMMVEQAESFSIDVSSDGVRQPHSVYQDTPIFLMGYNSRFLGLINDSFDSLGSFTQLPYFKNNKFYSRLFSARNMPTNRKVLDFYDAILVYKPDFSRWSEAQMDAVVAYVANGGTLIFAHPDAIREAAKTPLGALLPVDPVRIHTLSELPPVTSRMSSFDPESKWQIDVLEVTNRGRGITTMEWDGMPLIRSSQYGMGKVTAVMFPLDDKTLNDAGHQAQESLLKEVLIRQELFPMQKDFAETLDKLTGFEIPSPGEIVALLAIYLAGFAMILLLGIFTKRAGTSWFVAVIFSVLMVTFILKKAAGAFSDRGSVLAEISMEMPEPYPVGETYASCFAVKESKVNAGIPAATVMFSPIPESSHVSSFFVTSMAQDLTMLDENGNSMTKPKKEVRIKSPIDFLRSRTGQNTVNGLHIAPRTSKQFMASHTPVLTTDGGKEYPEAELLLTETGIALNEYTLPEKLRKNNPESVYLIMPGGFRKVEFDETGLCTVQPGNIFITDVVTRSVVESLCAGLRKQNPYLAVIYNVKQNRVQLKEPMTPQGRHIVMLPVRPTVASRKIRIPAEMLVFTAGSSMARTFLSGNKLNPQASLMVGQPYSPQVMLPGFLIGIFKPETVTVDYDCSVVDGINVDVYLENNDPKAGPDEKKIMGKADSRTRMEFTADTDAALSPCGSMITLTIEPHRLADTFDLSPEQAIRTNFWSLRSLRVTMTGTVDEKQALPIRY